MSKRKWFSQVRTWSLEEEKKKKGERIQQLQQQLQDGVKSLMDSPDWQEQIRALLIFKSKFHQYSFGNAMRILMQFPKASYVASFSTWKNKFKRKVKRGAKAIYVLAPRFVVKENSNTSEKEKVIIGWGTEAVFDISQTEETLQSIPVPSSLGYELIGDSQPARWLKARLFEIAKQENITVEYGETGKANGYYVPKKHLIRLSTELTSTDEECMVFLHEMIHAFRHARFSEKAGERNDYAEVVVEGAAFVIAAFYGLDVDRYSFSYIATWAKDIDTLLMLGREVEKESKRFIEIIDQLGKIDWKQTGLCPLLSK
jgi:hypothetical protein